MAGKKKVVTKKKAVTKKKGVRAKGPGGDKSRRHMKPINFKAQPQMMKVPADTTMTMVVVNALKTWATIDSVVKAINKAGGRKQRGTGVKLEADRNWARTWMAESYLGPYGFGMESKQDAKGNLLFRVIVPDKEHPDARKRRRGPPSGAAVSKKVATKKATTKKATTKKATTKKAPVKKKVGAAPTTQKKKVVKKKAPQKAAVVSNDNAGTPATA